MLSRAVVVYWLTLGVGGLGLTGGCSKSQSNDESGSDGGQGTGTTSASNSDGNIDGDSSQETGAGSFDSSEAHSDTGDDNIDDSESGSQGNGSDSDAESDSDDESSSESDRESTSDEPSDSDDTLVETGNSTDTETGMGQDQDTDTDSESPTGSTDSETSEPVSCPDWLAQIDDATRAAGGLRLSDQFSSKALFPSSDQVVMLLSSNLDDDATVKIIDLPSLEERVLSPAAFFLDWLEFDQTLFVVHNEDDISAVTLDGVSQTLSESACDYWPSPHNRAFVLESCGDEGGALSIVDHGSGTKQQLADNYPKFYGVRPPAFSRDGSLAAYVGFEGTDDNRLQAVFFVDATGTVSRITDWAESWGGLFFLDDDSILIQSQSSFLEHDLMRYIPSIDELIPLASSRHALFSDTGYTLSPDQRYLLAADVTVSGNDPNVLVKIGMDGEGEQELATNLHRYQDSAAFVTHLFDFTADGQYVVYLAQWEPEMRLDSILAMVPTSGGDPVAIAPAAYELEWDLSPTGNNVAYVYREDTTDGDYELRINTPNLDERTILTQDDGSLSNIAYAPSGEGILFIKSGAPVTLNYIDVDGGNSVHIGDIGRPQGGIWYTIDPSGCYVIYQAETDSQSGTYLQPVPRTN